MSYYQHYDDYEDPYSYETRDYGDGGGTRASEFTAEEPQLEPYSYDAEPYGDIYDYPEVDEPPSEPYGYSAEPYGHVAELYGHSYVTELDDVHDHLDRDTLDTYPQQDSRDHPTLDTDDLYPAAPEPGELANDGPVNHAHPDFERSRELDHPRWSLQHRDDLGDDPSDYAESTHHHSPSPPPFGGFHNLTPDHQHHTVPHEYADPPYEAEYAPYGDDVVDFSQVHPCYWPPEYRPTEPAYGDRVGHEREEGTVEGEHGDGEAWRAEPTRYGVEHDIGDVGDDNVHAIPTPGYDADRTRWADTPAPNGPQPPSCRHAHPIPRTHSAPRNYEHPLHQCGPYRSAPPARHTTTPATSSAPSHPPAHHNHGRPRHNRAHQPSAPARYRLPVAHSTSTSATSSAESAPPSYRSTGVQTPSSARTRDAPPHMRPHHPEPLDLAHLSPAALLAPLAALHLTESSDATLPAAATAALEQIVALARSLTAPQSEPRPTSSSNAERRISARDRRNRKGP
ncbi:hypothetical protein FIBSPDRAFT_865112 [Athelia psychrophila]|uniref:Uncharacterized protein n=1 Tax=Athelia psychrophila TaxID=1759441 RepID=A0A166FWP3_9AGAM|nr:hypothetical protein FIBSPDRAFT_865112 [Fibularhizoctonia sp. CBS 109695]